MLCDCARLDTRAFRPVNPEPRVNDFGAVDPHSLSNPERWASFPIAYAGFVPEC